MKITAQVVLINPEGLILGVSRKDDHTSMGLPGGKMEECDKTVLDTAYRETFEETGLRISNLELIFAIHKDGFMGYTYLAEFSGEISHTEPHLVKWLPMERLVMGRFGKYNKMVSDSLIDKGIKFVYEINLDEVSKEVEEYVSSNEYDTGLKLKFVSLNKRKDWLGNDSLILELTHDNGDIIDEELDFNETYIDDLRDISTKHGFKFFNFEDGYFSK